MSSNYWHPPLPFLPPPFSSPPHLWLVQAYRLHQQLAEVLEKRDEWREKDKETPQEERERLLRQVKADNQEIANLQKKWAGR